MPLFCCLLVAINREEDCEAVECVDDEGHGGWISELVYLWVVL